MKKEQVCVFISNEDELQEMREFLESKGEVIATDGTFAITVDFQDNLQRFSRNGGWYLNDKFDREIITKEQFKALFD